MAPGAPFFIADAMAALYFLLFVLRYCGRKGLLLLVKGVIFYEKN